MFIRCKKVKKSSGHEYEYAHLVKGEWKTKRRKQTKTGTKYTKYNNSIHQYTKTLGKVHRYIQSNKDIENFEEEIQNLEKIEEVYRHLLKTKLENLDFKKKTDNIYTKDGIYVDMDRLMVHDGKTDVVLKVSKKSGYLCGYTLEKLFEIKKIENRHEGIHLLKKLRMTGIELKPEEFYLLAQKMIKY